MKTKSSKIMTPTFISICIVLIAVSLLPAQVVAVEDDIGISVGDIFRWTITDIDNEFSGYELYEEGDTKVIKIEAINHYNGEDTELWSVFYSFLDFEEEEGEDTFHFIGEPLVIYTNASYEEDNEGHFANYAQAFYEDTSFIAGEDLEDFLKDLDNYTVDVKAKNLKLTYSETYGLGDTNYTRIYEYNDLGILMKHTFEINDTMALEFELAEGGISFGIHYLIFIPIGIICGIFIIKRRLEVDQK